ncbi:PIG-L family deacetylase [candidate division WWE3 bacterium]|jgi:LmbE family N-acetylglucosaminyl deacetylase|uniref:PIG-L family deacetylase n=1 Tax=candidate division WWE3 bacterium TaxID=2053526 RepID=A0A3A4ZJH2_UNCKA|nr:MAG: PIG-L family deacetylase [candidate division WWE3 bacterium]
MQSDEKYKSLVSFNRLILAVPHPDDETYYSAGLIQRLNSLGKFLKVIVMTKGENSTLRYGVLENENLPDVREKEFMKIIRILGVTHYALNKFKDGGIESESDKVSKYLSSEIEGIKPDAVVTYEPSGVYGHPDHVALTKIIEELSKIYPFEIIYLTVGSSYNTFEDAVHMAKDPDSIKPIEPDLVLKLTSLETINKLRAILAYKSQFKFDLEFVWKLLRRRLLTREFLKLNV